MMKLIRKQHRFFVAVMIAVLSISLTAPAQTPQQPEKGQPLPLQAILGKWKGETDGSQIVITRIADNRVRFEGKHEWIGTYSNGRLEFTRYPTVEQMAVVDREGKQIPLWAKQAVKLPVAGVGSKNENLDLSRYLKWVMRLQIEDSCEETALSGEWDPGEISWVETKTKDGNGQVVEVKQEASASKGTPKSLKFIRVEPVDPTPVFRILDVVIDNPALKKKIDEIQDTIRKRSAELEPLKNRFNEAAERHNQAVLQANAITKKKEAVGAMLKPKIERLSSLTQELERVTQELEGARARQRRYERDMLTIAIERVRIEIAPLERQRLEIQKKEDDAIANSRSTYESMNAAFEEWRARERQIDEFWKQLYDLTKDPFVQRVRVHTKGYMDRVFEARYDGYDDDLGSKIEKAKEAMEKARTAKDKAFDAFYKESKQAITALKEVYERMNLSAESQYLTELGFAAFDLVEAGIKGGPGGIVVEGLRKIGETGAAWFTEENVGDLSGVDEGSIEAQINAVYQESLKDATSTGQLQKIAIQRGAKELVTRRIRNLGNQTLGSGYTLAQLKRYSQSADDLNRILNQANYLKEKKVYKVKDLGKSLVKDGLKTAVRKTLQQPVVEAWEIFFQHDIKARILFPLYQVASDTYWKAFDAYQSLLEERRNPKKYDPSAVLKVTLRKSVPEGTPLIVLVEPTRQENQESVSLGDKQAEPLGDHRFCVRLPLRRLSPTIGLTLRITPKQG